MPKPPSPMYAPDLVADVILRVRERPASRGSREGLFRQLVAELVRHEVAEEEILRPVSRRDAGDSIADARYVAGRPTVQGL